MTQIPLPFRLIARARRAPWRLIERVLGMHPYFAFARETATTQTPATVESWIRQNVLGVNSGPYWPVHASSTVVNWRNIVAGIETSPGQMPGCYIQAIGSIEIGDYTQIAPNVGIISANHALHDNRQHVPRAVKIGRYCWLGMGALILPGVTLGDYTIVGAGAVVTRSFPEGYCVIAGNPARHIKDVDRSECIQHRSENEYHGYIPASRFAEFQRRHLRAEPTIHPAAPSSGLHLRASRTDSHRRAK